MNREKLKEAFVGGFTVEPRREKRETPTRNPGTANNPARPEKRSNTPHTPGPASAPARRTQHTAERKRRGTNGEQRAREEQEGGQDEGRNGTAGREREAGSESKEREQAFGNQS